MGKSSNYILGFFQQAMRVIQIVQRIGLREHQNQKPWKTTNSPGKRHVWRPGPKGVLLLASTDGPA